MAVRRKPQRGDIMVVKWRDHFSHAVEISAADIQEDTVYDSVGWYLRDNDHFIFLVRDRQDETMGTVAAVLAIAKVLILEQHIVAGEGA